MIKIYKHTLALGVAILMMSGVSEKAHAGQVQDNIQACRTAMNVNMGFKTGISGEEYYKLKRIRGSQVQKLTFKARTETGIKTIICSVKRTKILALTDDKKRPLLSLGLN